jgi:hypothetical protein
MAKEEVKGGLRLNNSNTKVATKGRIGERKAKVSSIRIQYCLASRDQQRATSIRKSRRNRGRRQKATADEHHRTFQNYIFALFSFDWTMAHGTSSMLLPCLLII